MTTEELLTSEPPRIMGFDGFYRVHYVPTGTISPMVVSVVGAERPPSKQHKVAESLTREISAENSES